MVLVEFCSEAILGYPQDTHKNFLGIEGGLGRFIKICQTFPAYRKNLAQVCFFAFLLSSVLRFGGKQTRTNLFLPAIWNQEVDGGSGDPTPLRNGKLHFI